MGNVEFTPEPGKELIKYEANRDNMDVEFYDPRKLKPLTYEFGNTDIEFRPDNHFIIRYREAPQYDRVCFKSADGELKTMYDNPDLINWLSGFKMDGYRIESCLNRGRSIIDVCGWASDVLIKDWPDPEEKAEYELSQCWDLYSLGQVSVKQILEAVEEEDES